MDLDHLQALLGETDDSLSPELTDSERDVWVIAEMQKNTLAPSAGQLLGKARELASDLGTYVQAAILGSAVTDIGNQLIALGADIVHVADDPALDDYSLDSALEILTPLITRHTPLAIFFPSGRLGDLVAPRLAQRMNALLTTQVVSLRPDFSSRAITADYAVYDGEYHESRVPIQADSGDPAMAIQMFSILPGIYYSPEPDPYRKGKIEILDINLASSTDRVKVLGSIEYARPLPGLDTARRIVAVGDNLGKANLNAARTLASRIDAQLAGDRGAAAAGWIDYNHIVGLTGHHVVSDLYLALGIWGGAEHNVGIERARYVVAVHSNPTAPIFKVADLGIVAEPGNILAQLV